MKTHNAAFRVMATWCREEQRWFGFFNLPKFACIQYQKEDSVARKCIQRGATRCIAAFPGRDARCKYNTFLVTDAKRILLISGLPCWLASASRHRHCMLGINAEQHDRFGSSDSVWSAFHLLSSGLWYYYYFHTFPSLSSIRGPPSRIMGAVL